MAAISLESALQRVLTVPCGRTREEFVPLPLALGRHLAAPVGNDAPWPATDRSAMDGFAVRAVDCQETVTVLAVQGQSLAGHPFAGTLQPGRAVQIMTGAVVPAGADAVVQVEHTTGFDQPVVTIQATAPVKPGQNIRPRGSELAAGQPVLGVGQRIRAAEIGALAVLGITEVPVFARPRVAILATGDEVVPVDSVPLPHQVRESNSWALAAQVAECGGEPIRLGVAADDALALRPLLEHGMDEADVLLTIGGISKGTHDLVHGLLAGLGVEQEFHGIELKPGKPTFFGTAQRGDGRSVFVFGLPGNPASCFTVFDLLVAPLLARLLGQQPTAWQAQAVLAGAPFKPNARLQATPAHLRLGEGARAIAELRPASPSGDPFSLLGANGYALLPKDARPGQLTQVTVVDHAAGIRLA